MSLPLVLLLAWARLGAGCPAVCRCEGFRRLRRVDCMNLGLRSVPSNLSSSTASLNLQNKNISVLPEDAFTGNPSIQMMNIQNNLLHTLDRSSVQLQPGLNPPYVEIVLITSTTPGDTPAEEVQVHAGIQIRNVSMTHSDVTRVSISALSSNRLSLRHRLEASGSGPLTCTDPSAASPPADPSACLELSLWLHITVSFIFIIFTLLIPSWRQSVVAALFLRVQPAD